MKSKIIFAMFLMLTAVIAFAQPAEGITFNAWGRGAFAPLIVLSDQVKEDGTVVKDHLGNAFVGIGSIRPSYGFEHELYLKGELNNVGFQLGLSYDGEASPGQTSNKYWYNYLGAAIWIKPLGNEWLKVTGGTFSDHTLRGKIGEVNKGWEEFVLSGARAEDDIFTSFAGYGGEFNHGNLGLMLSSSPLEGLFLGIRVNAPGIDDVPSIRTADAYRFFQAGAGYEIPKVGHVRIQYLGGYLGKESYNVLQQYIKDANIDYSGTGDPFSATGGIPRQLNPNQWHGYPARMETAFALTAIDDLLFDIGFKIYFPVTTGGTIRFPSIDYEDKYLTSWGGMSVSAGIVYNINDFSITSRIDSTFGSYKRSSENDKNLYGDGSNPLTLDIRLVPSYNFGFATVGLDCAYAILKGNEIDIDGNPVEPSKAMSKWGIGAFISKGFTNGYIKVGVTYTNPIIYANEAQKLRGAEKIIQVPVIMEYNF